MLTISGVISIKTWQNNIFSTVRRRKLMTSSGHYFQISSKVHLLYEKWQKVTPHLHRENLDMNGYVFGKLGRLCHLYTHLNSM